MSSRSSTACLLDPPGEIPSESTGFPGQDEVHPTGRQRNRRPLSMAWISDELLAKTIDVWSTNYGRPISEDEAVEILMNVKRLAEVLLEARKEIDGT
ncbi:MAG TPA: hypothetical protein PLV57_20795 [Phycisphaerae bacterium]|nr:hypothetical protein [Phycisphaerae bacterium]HPP28952.1 hypothetical protein [Phycisphaerae bacterium]